jgi:membrane protease YdiL (CAAX protease family)
MPTDPVEATVRMATAFGLVAAVAVPVGLVGGRLGRRAVPPAFPVPTADDPVLALGYLMLFAGHLVGVAVLGQLAESAGLPQRFAVNPVAEVLGVWQSLFGSLFAAPFLAGVWYFFCSTYRVRATWRSACWAVGVGVAGWLVSPAVYGVNGAAEWLSSLAGVTAGEHPLVKVVGTADAGRAALLFGAVCVATPFAEEVVFRGLLLGWLIRRPRWLVMPVALALLLTAGATSGTARLLAVGFLASLVVGLVAVRGRPELAAIWATSTLFAAVHASVWPTPVPLFLLGLVLGWVAVRTGGVLAGTVLHGLFNAVSLVYLLRG